MLLVITEVLRLDINIMEFWKQGLAVVQSIRSNGSSDEDPFPKASGQDQIPILCKHRTFLWLGCESPMATIISTAPMGTANRTFIIHLSSGIAGSTCNIPA